MKRILRGTAAPAIALLGVALPSTAQESAAVFEAPTVVWDEFSRVTNVADLDGDGFPDAIGTWYSTSPLGQVAVRAWRNDGAGAFSPIWTLNLPGSSIAALYSRLATGDLDLDGKDDVVVAIAGIVRYFLSNGTAPPTLWATVFEPDSVEEMVAADFDGDGRVDVAYVTTSGAATSLKVLLTGSAGPATPGATAGIPVGADNSLFVAQVEVDGLPDLGVVGAYGTQAELRLFPVSGGAPGTPLTFALGSVNQPMPTSGDVDGDGDHDVVVFAASGEYTVVRRTGPSTFSLEPPVPGGPATDLADVDGDGDLDGVCCGGGGGGSAPTNGGLSLFEIAINEGGVFAPSFTIQGLGASRIAAAVDVDGDGDTDLVAGRCVYYAKGPIAGLPSGPVTGSLPETHAFSDLDRDGDPDLHFGLGSALRNAADGSFASEPPVAPAPPAGTSWVGPGWTGDLDGDGDPDVVVAHLQAGGAFLGMRLLRNNGGGGLVDGGAAAAPGVDMRALSTPFGPVYATMAPGGAFPADADGDGDVDLVVRGLGLVSSSKIWWNDGTGFFTAGPDVVGTYAKRVANLDANPAPDLLGIAAPYTGSGPLVLRRGLGGGAFGPSDPTPVFDYAALNDRFDLADLDGDGDLDLAGVNGVVPMVRANDGNGVFTTALSLAPSAGSLGDRRVLVGDLDGDGSRDVIVFPAPNTANRGATIYRGTGAPLSFGPGTVQLVSAAALSDIDGDGDLDGVGLQSFRNRTFHGPSAGLRRQYGTGLAGSGGMIPILGGVGPFRPGSLCETRITGALGGSVGIFALGTQAANSPIVGGTLLATPLVLFGFPLGGTPGAAGEGIATIPWLAPPSIAGASLYQQVGIVDPAAPQGIALSNGLLYTIGL